MQFLDELGALAVAGSGQLDHFRDCAQSHYLANLQPALEQLENLNIAFERVSQLPVRDWPSPFLTAAFDRLFGAYVDATNASRVFFVSADGADPTANAGLLAKVRQALAAYRARGEDLDRQIDAVRQLG